MFCLTFLCHMLYKILIFYIIIHIVNIVDFLSGEILVSFS